MKKNGAFHFPMKKSEAVIGWIYFFLHVIVMSYLLKQLGTDVFPKLGLTMTTATLNLLYYGIGFVFLLVFLFNYLRTSFNDLCGNFFQSLTSVILGYIVYFVSLYAVSKLLGLMLDEVSNPNNEAISAQMKLNPNVMIVVGVLLAPIVEETLFRGVVFGTIRKRSRWLAYAVSAVLFAVYHLFDYMLHGFSWELVICALQYIPAGLVLCWCYERSKNIWAPVFLHMLVNYLSVSVSIGL